MNDYKELLDKIESELLKALFYKNRKRALVLFKKKNSLLKPTKTAQWLLDEIDLKPFGASVRKKLSAKNILKNLDMVYLKPLRFEDYSLKNLKDVKDFNYCAIEGSIYSIKKRRSIYSIFLKTDEGFVSCNWFRLTPYTRNLINALKKSETVVCLGQIRFDNFKYTMNHPKIVRHDKFVSSKETIYPSILNMRNSTTKKIIDNILKEQPKKPYDYLPYTLIAKNRLLFLSETIDCFHTGKEEDEVVRRLKYEELFMLLFGLRLQEKQIKSKYAPAIDINKKQFADIVNALDFKLTNDQIKVLHEIFLDFKKEEPMLRLLQGDVGCGKTIVALISALFVNKNGYQAVFLAPTQPLAQQVFQETKKTLERYDINIEILLSSTKNKNEIYEKIKNGEIDLIVGTHALLQEDVEFKNLGFIVIDEQHRFGVEQRKTIMGKGLFPHVLIMSATPIPRSLAMVLYSKTNLSTIKEKPRGRINVKTLHFYEKDREKAYEIAKKEMEKSHQVYVVAPLIDESESMKDMKNVNDLYEKLKAKFKDFKVELLHGKMNPQDKEKIVKNFRNGYIDCLISTTVIEVGIDVKNATVIIIENAERFGLSQLHQLRGRVGRSFLESYALLVTKNSLSDVAEKRIEAMLSTNDGFELANIDYQLRGSGEILGTKQHGKDLVYTDIINDSGLIKTVKDDIDRLIKLNYPINEGLKMMLEYKWQKKINYIYVG